MTIDIDLEMCSWLEWKTIRHRVMAWGMRDRSNGSETSHHLVASRLFACRFSSAYNSLTAV